MPVPQCHGLGGADLTQDPAAIPIPAGTARASKSEKDGGITGKESKGTRRCSARSSTVKHRHRPARGTPIPMPSDETHHLLGWGRAISKTQLYLSALGHQLCPPGPCRRPSPKQGQCRWAAPSLAVGHHGHPAAAEPAGRHAAPARGRQGHTPPGRSCTPVTLKRCKIITRE